MTKPPATLADQIRHDTAAYVRQARRAANGNRAPRPRRAEEQDLQISIAQFLDLALKHPETFWTAFPAGGGGKARGGQLKAMGLKAGVPDLLVIHAGRVLWIELKRPAAKGRRAGTTSDAQDDMHDALRRAGCWTIVCRSLVEVQRALEAHHVPLSARVA